MIATAVILGLFILSATALYFLGHRYGDELKALAIQEVNNRLAIPLEVEEVDVTIWAHFPNIAIDLRGIESGEDKIYGTQPQAVRSEHLYLVFNPLDILFKKYRLRRIVLEKGELNLILFWNGSDNYHFFLAGQDTTNSETALDLTFDEVKLKDFGVNYRDLKSDQFHQFFIDDALVRGKLDNGRFVARAEAGIGIRELRSGETIFLEEKEAKLIADIEVFVEDGGFQWSEGEFEMDGIALNTRGSIRPSYDLSVLEMNFVAKNAPLKDVIACLPVDIREELMDYDPEGTLSFSMDIKGEAGDEHLPAITASWQWEDGAVQLCEGRDAKMEKISARGKYESGVLKDYSGQELIAESFRGMLNAMPVKAGFHVKRFGILLIEGNISTVLETQKLPECWAGELPAEGKVALEGNFRYDESKKEKDKWSEALLLALKGEFSEASFKDEKIGIDLSASSAVFTLRGGNLDITGFSGKLSGNSISGNISLDGLLPWIDGITPRLDIRAGIKAESLPVGMWIDAEGDGSEGKTIWPENISANIDIEVGRVEYRDFHAEELSGNIQLDKGFLYAHKLRMQTMRGELGIQGVLQPVQMGFQLRSQAQLIGIDISEMFLQMGEFGQEDMTHKNLSGRLDANIDLAMFLDEAMMPSPASIVAGADLRISEGVIVDYAPLKELPKFIKAGNLDRVRIEPLENHITIKEEKVIIPEMAVNTDAMDLVVSGKHYFDQRIDYSLKVLLSEILGNKAKRENQQVTEFGMIEDDGLGRTTLFIKVSGTAQNPEFAYDRKEVLKKIGRDLKAESRELGKILREEFSWLKRDSLERAKQDREEDRLKKQEDGKFIIEWDPDSL